MAEVPVQRTRRPAWPWILGLVVLVLLVWWLVSRDDADVDVTDYPTPAEPGAVVAVDPAPLTDVVAVVTVADPTPLIGRRVRLTGVNVLSVPGDSIFWIGPSESQRLLVVLDETTTAGIGQDTVVNVDPGSQVNLAGTIRALPADLQAWQTRWRLNDEAMSTLRGQRFYVDADTASLVRR